MNPTIVVRIDADSTLLCGYINAGIQLNSGAITEVGLPRYPWASQILVESLLKQSGADTGVRAVLNSFRTNRRGVVSSLVEPVVDRLAAAGMIKPVRSFDEVPFWSVTPHGEGVSQKSMSAMSDSERVRLVNGALHAQAIIVAWLKRFRTVEARKSAAAV